MRTSIVLLPLIILLYSPPPAGAQPNKELVVLVVSPKGQTGSIDQSSTIFASFNEPMVPLKDVPPDEATGPLLIQPRIKGKYRWMGTRTVAFVPERTLPYASTFTATIPAGTKSRSGRLLRSAYRWEFETPRPLLLSHVPSHRQRFVELDHSVLLQFNQKIDPQQASKSISLEETGATGAAYPLFTARWPSEEELKSNSRGNKVLLSRETALLLVPVERYKKGHNYTVRCKAGLKGVEGPLGMSGDESFSFTTLNELVFKGVLNGDRFNPSQTVNLSFSNPVSVKDVAKRLVFEPPARVNEVDYDYETEEVQLSVQLEAERSYKGILKAGWRDRFRNEATRDTSFTFRTGSFAPSVRMTTGPGVIEAYQSHKYPVTLMNMDSVLVQQGRIPSDRIVPLLRQLDFSSSAEFAEEEGVLEYEDIRSEQPKEFSVSRVWHLKEMRNRQTVRPVDLDEVVGTSGTAVVLLQIDNLRPAPSRRYLKALLQVTHLGITAKFSPETNLIWVTKLNDASPVRDATVELRSDSNAVLWTGRTDAKGLVRSPGWGRLGLTAPNEWQQPRQWIIVKNGNDLAFSNSDWQNGIEPWSFGINADWNPKFEPMDASLFTDRGLYRAGESVEIKGIVRSRVEGVLNIPRNPSLRLVVRNTRNEEVFTAEPKLSPFGSFASTVSLKASSPLGYYAMLLESRDTDAGTGNWHTIGSGSFRVEAFRPAQFEVIARSEKTSYIIGDTFAGYLSARYLFGAPVKKEPVTWRISIAGTSWTPEGWGGYFFGPLPWLSRYSARSGYRLLLSKQEKLDDQGSIRVKSDLKVGELAGTSTLLFEGDVTAPSRQQISGRISIVLHGGEYYVGISPSTTFLSADSTLKYKLVAVTPGASATTGVPLSIRVVQRLWRSVRKAESGGRYTWISEADDVTVDSAAVRTGEEPIERTFRARQAGFYYIQAEGKDGRGNVILSQAYFYVSGGSYVAWERSNDDRIELVADKTHLTPGDVARVLVKSPYEEATALVTIEREGILRYYTTTLRGSAPQLNIPVTREDVPNVYVSVVLLQGRKEQAPRRPGLDGMTKEADVGRPSFKVGYVQLSLDPKQKQLTVAVTPDKKDYHPGDSIEVNLLVKDSEGKAVAGEVALSVVDLGVLNLIRYRLPDVFNIFYAERPLAVRTAETRMHLVEQREYGEKGEDQGGGGAEEKMLAATSAEGIRRDFRASAYWNPSIMTDSKGAATVKFKLPDNLTTFQIMAVAQTVASHFGYGENSFQVNKPLLLQPALPRFARLGDAFEGGVVIHNYSEREKTVRLTISALGVKSFGRDSSVHGLRPGQALEVRRKFLATKAGKATFTFRARADDGADGLQWTIPIQAPRTRESLALFESTVDSVVREHILVPRNIHSELGGLEFSTASTAMLGLRGGISYLASYPYGCLEQRLSATLPIILAKEMVEAFRLEVYKDRDYRKVVEKLLEELPAFQRENGGFAYWKNVPETWPYISAYAAYTMVQARRMGYPIEKRVLEGGMEYLRRVLRDEEKCLFYTKHAWGATRALILYTLALSDTPEYGYMEKLYRQRSDLPLFGKAYLLRALYVSHGDQSMIQDLLRGFTNQAKIAPTSAHYEERDGGRLQWVFDSNIRTTALVMQALVETQPQNPLIPKMVRWILDQQKNGAWRTTQENLYVVDALATYFQSYEKEEPGFRAQVALAGRTVLDEVFDGRSFKTGRSNVPGGELVPGSEQQIDVKKQGKGRLYYSIRLNYYPKGDTKGRDEGLSVLKTIQPMNEQTTAEKSYAAGAMLKVTLTVVSNQARNFVAVNDPLAAGFEAVNLTLQTTGTNLSQFAGTEPEQDWWAYNPFNHYEMYDDRLLLFADYVPAGVHTFTYLMRATSFGVFQLPSTRAEGMYEPEVFGQTSSQVVEVK